MTSNLSFANAASVSPPEHFVGLDLGQAHDPTAIAVIERTQVCLGRSPVDFSMTIATRLSIRHLERLPLGLDYPTMVHRVSDLVSRPELSHCTTLIVDATGVGRPVVDMLRGARLPCRLMPVTITGGERETCDNGYWRVPKRDLITGLLVLLQRGELDICGHLPEAKTLVKELGSMRIKVSLDGHNTYGAWREGDHDDLVLAAALACWRGGRVEQSIYATQPLF